MTSSAVRVNEGQGAGQAGAGMEAAAALAAIRAAARRVERAAGSGSAHMLGHALGRLVDATRAVEELDERLGERGADAAGIAEAAYRRGAASRRLTPVR